jgi:tRNA C32,U32 (ribose-2'-O)-methylase TrmJ
MKIFVLGRLVLVAPNQFPHAEADVLACGAADAGTVMAMLTHLRPR